MKELEESVLSNLDNGISETANFNIYPQPMSDHLKNRVKECGKLMYGALEIGKEDVDGRLNQLKQAALNRGKMRQINLQLKDKEKKKENK